MPYFGLCLGLQCAVIEFAREVAGSKDANSTEFDMSPRTRSSTSCPTSASSRTRAARCASGLYPARLTPGSKAAAAYGAEVIYERHRHRFEVNNRYRETLEPAGMLLSGQSPDGRLVEIVELKDHPWFVASQFHPEFKSRPERPHPLFHGFIEAALAGRRGPRAGLRATVRSRSRSTLPRRARRSEPDGLRLRLLGARRWADAPPLGRTRQRGPALGVAPTPGRPA